MRELRRELVRRDVYDAQRLHDQARIDSLERVVTNQAAAADKRDETERGLRRQIGLALFVAVLGMVAQPLLSLIN